MKESWHTFVLPERIGENELIRRYDVSRTHLQKVLSQIAGEGWLERLPGRGGAFNGSLAAGEACITAYQFRGAIEAKAVLSPDFKVDASASAGLRRQQERLLETDVNTLSRQQLYEFNTSSMRVSFPGRTIVFPGRRVVAQRLADQPDTAAKPPSEWCCRRRTGAAAAIPYGGLNTACL